MPGDAEPAGASVHGADRDVDGWVGLHCGKRERGSCAAASAVQRRGPGRRQAPGRQDPTSRPDHIPPHPCHSQTPGKYSTKGFTSSPSPSPGHSKQRMRNIKLQKKEQLKGRGRPKELTYGGRNPQRLGGCWTRSRHCWRHTGTLRRKSCLPQGQPAGRRSAGPRGNTGTAPGSRALDCGDKARAARGQLRHSPGTGLRRGPW